MVGNRSNGDLLLDEMKIGTTMVRRLARGSAHPFIGYQFHKPNDCFALIKLVYAGTEEFDGF
ncbi:hypothetical protein [Skermanella pratensis]|uniref:hypothetical protein n=1 Tax=Skermanella pratensis TaxID=2233999 RepID=UPI0013015D0F|nr:hypothetical protein [Skermanella pratensis]